MRNRCVAATHLVSNGRAHSGLTRVGGWPMVLRAERVELSKLGKASNSETVRRNVAEMETKVFHIDVLREFSTRIFLHFGVPQEDAAQAADVLASADLRGIDSHGVARLYSYFGMLSEGHINPKPRITTVRSTLSTATIDGDNGLGLVVGPQANRIAMDMADKAGSGWVSVCNTNHFGIAGYYVLQALERDLIGWAMTNSTSLVTPLWGMERMLGTNPIAIAFPGKEEPPHNKSRRHRERWRAFTARLRSRTRGPQRLRPGCDGGRSQCRAQRRKLGPLRSALCP